MTDEPRKKWPLELRYHDDGSPDEVVCDDAFVHLEQMDDTHWWMMVTHEGSKRSVHVNFSSKTKIRVSFEEEDAPE